MKKYFVFFNCKIFCFILFVNFVFVYLGCDEGSSGVNASDDPLPVSSSAIKSMVDESSCSMSQMQESSSTLSNVVYGEMIDERDNHTYKTVVIGSQTWMAENLNYADSVKTPSLKEKNWCFANIEENCLTEGRLYTWGAAIDSIFIYEETSQLCGFLEKCERVSDSAIAIAPIQGICPKGWHLPSYEEWNQLIDFVGGESFGRSLKSEINWDGTNTTGFSAFQVGCYKISFFAEDNHEASFWSSSLKQNISIEASGMRLSDYDNFIHLDSKNKRFGYNIRCIKD